MLAAVDSTQCIDTNRCHRSTTLTNATSISACHTSQWWQIIPATLIVCSKTSLWRSSKNCKATHTSNLTWNKINGEKCYTHTRLTAFFPGLPRWAGTRKIKPIWILLKQETVSGSGISCAICKYASLHLAPDRQPYQHPTTPFFTGRMPFLPPNQQRQSSEGKK